MLKGFAAPRSPLGAAAWVPPPPWYFAGDVLAIEFWNDPDVSVDTLPTGVEFEADRTGHSVALFSDYQFTAQNEEYLDPTRYQCRGFSVLLDATWKGSRTAWCPYSYADNDGAVLRGWIQGYPKKLGTRPGRLQPRVQRRRRSSTRADSPLACLPMASCWRGRGLRFAKKRLTLPVCLIAGLSGAGTFRAYAWACTIGLSSMSSFAASRTTY